MWTDDDMPLTGNSLKLLLLAAGIGIVLIAAVILAPSP